MSGWETLAAAKLTSGGKHYNVLNQPKDIGPLVNLWTDEPPSSTLPPVVLDHELRPRPSPLLYPTQRLAESGRGEGLTPPLQQPPPGAKP